MDNQEIITEQIKFLRSLLADGTLKVTKEYRIDDVNTSLNKIEKSVTINFGVYNNENNSKKNKTNGKNTKEPRVNR